MHSFNVRTNKRRQLIDITDEVISAVRQSGATDGLVCVFVPHTTAGVTINENADPDVTYDVLAALEKVFPSRADYRHLEGNSDAHVQSSVISPSITLILEDGKLRLGTWQCIYFAEFDGPRTRQCWVKILSSS